MLAWLVPTALGASLALSPQSPGLPGLQAIPVGDHDVAVLRPISESTSRVDLIDTTGEIAWSVPIRAPDPWARDPLALKGLSEEDIVPGTSRLLLHEAPGGVAVVAALRGGVVAWEVEDGAPRRRVLVLPATRQSRMQLLRQPDGDGVVVVDTDGRAGKTKLAFFGAGLEPRGAAVVDTWLPERATLGPLDLGTPSGLRRAAVDERGDVWLLLATDAPGVEVWRVRPGELPTRWSTPLGARPEPEDTALVAAGGTATAVVLDRDGEDLTAVVTGDEVHAMGRTDLGARRGRVTIEGARRVGDRTLVRLDGREVNLLAIDGVGTLAWSAAIERARTGRTAWAGELDRIRLGARPGAVRVVVNRGRALRLVDLALSDGAVVADRELDPPTPGRPVPALCPTARDGRMLVTTVVPAVALWAPVVWVDPG